jgi:hypothetical protein
LAANCSELNYHDPLGWRYARHEYAKRVVLPSGSIADHERRTNLFIDQTRTPAAISAR